MVSGTTAGVRLVDPDLIRRLRIMFALLRIRFHEFLGDFTPDDVYDASD